MFTVVHGIEVQNCVLGCSIVYYFVYIVYIS